MRIVDYINRFHNNSVVLIPNTIHLCTLQVYCRFYNKATSKCNSSCNSVFYLKFRQPIHLASLSIALLIWTISMGFFTIGIFFSSWRQNVKICWWDAPGTKGLSTVLTFSTSGLLWTATVALLTICDDRILLLRSKNFLQLVYITVSSTDNW